MKIAIVDDNAAMRAVLRAICEDEGHEVAAEFADGVGLLDYVINHRPDVVCLDHNLPGANGLELLAHMDAAANRVDVVMITGSDDPALKGAAAEAGAAGFIRKPFDSSQIVQELKDIVQTRGIAARAEAGAPVTETPEPVPAPRSVHDRVIARTAVIVDDSGSIRLLLKGILQGLGLKVAGTASSGREGIELVRQTAPALVCLDVDMPGMSGIDALPEIRAASPATRIVMVTGNASREIVSAAVAGGAKGYFLKPIRPARVEEFLSKLMQL